MSKLLDLYKRYRGLLLKQNAALDDLNEIEKENQQFIEIEKSIYEDNITAELQLAGLAAKLDGTKTELNVMESMLAKTDLSESDRKELVAKSQNKQDEKLWVEGEIVRYKLQEKETVKQLPWMTGANLTTDHLLQRHANLEKFCTYMDRYKYSSSLSMELIHIQGDLGKELKKANAKDKKEALDWCQKNSYKLQEQVFAKQNAPKNQSSFLRILQQAYHKTCLAHATYLDKPELITKVEQGKTSLVELEKLVEIRKNKQDLYRSLLPDYVLAEINPNIHIKGKKAFGFFKENTEKKVSDISSFLCGPLSDEIADKRKIKDLFETIKINLNDDQINNIYNKAKENQAAPLELYGPQL